MKRKKTKTLWCDPDCPYWGKLDPEPDNIITVTTPAGELYFCKRCLLSGEMTKRFADDPLTAQMIESVRAAFPLSEKGYNRFIFRLGQPDFLVLHKSAKSSKPKDGR